mgnify:CR=1 FL=1
MNNVQAVNNIVYKNETFWRDGYKIRVNFGRGLLIKGTVAPLQCSKSSPKMQNTMQKRRITRRNVALQL